MKRALALTVGFLALASCSLATWDDALGRSGFAYWQTGSNWVTIISVVNGSAVNDETIYIRFCDVHSNGCSDTTGDMFTIRAGEMLTFSTRPDIPTWIPTTAGYGYVLLRVENGGPVHAFCVVLNLVTWSGYVIPPFSPATVF